MFQSSVKCESKGAPKRSTACRSTVHIVMNDSSVPTHLTSSAWLRQNLVRLHLSF